jgi:methyl-accepting chemotaxis protein
MFNSKKVGTRLYALVGFLSLLLLMVGLLGLRSASQSNDGLDTVYKDRVVPLKDLKIIADMYAVNIVDTSHKVHSGSLPWTEGRARVDEATKIITEKWKAYLETTLVEKEKKLVAEIKPMMTTANLAVVHLTEILNNFESDTLKKFTVSELYPAIDPISNKFSELIDVQLLVAKGEYDKSQATYQQSKMLTIALILLGIALGGGFGFMIVRSITGPVIKAANLAGIMAGGDFSTQMHITSKDEIGSMGTSLNSMSGQLGNVMREIVAGVRSLATSSTDLSAVSQQLSASSLDSSNKASSVAAAAEEMSTNFQSVSAAMEQSSSNVSMVASAAEEMSATVNEIGQNAEKARAISENAVIQSQATSERMTALGESAKKVGRVTQTITEISEQTNLLALNATIEAARAGDAGKGFAVVANEIKELARQTATATVDIRNQIDDMQSSTITSIADIKKISEVIIEISNAINGIASAVEEQTTATAEISNNIAQASQGIAEVNENVAQSTVVVAGITRDIAQINEQSDQVGDGSNLVQVSAQGLSVLADQLEHLVKGFKVCPV